LQCEFAQLIENDPKKLKMTPNNLERASVRPLVSNPMGNTAHVLIGFSLMS